MGVVRPLAKQSLILVEKVDGSDTFVPLGCATSVAWNESAEIVVSNCRAGREKDYGSDVDIKCSISGMKKIYTGTDIAGNVSIDELKQWMRAGLKKKFRRVIADLSETGVVTLVPGSYTEEGTAAIASANEDAGETGRQSYSVELDFDTAGFSSTLVPTP